MMGGDITVRSVFGVGSEFTVKVRLRIYDAKFIGKETKERLEQFRFIKQTNEMSNEVVIKPMPYGKVLVVDDIETNLFVAQGLLEPYRIETETASSGQAAIDLIKSGKSFDIIFMDHMMPGLDGVQTTKIIRSSGYKKPIVALTANAIVGTKSLFLENGFNGYVSKPIDLKNLNEYLVKFILECHKDEAEKLEKSAAAPAPAKATISKDKIIGAFKKDAARSIPVLKKTSEDSDFKLFATTTHGIKSAAANCGLSEISELAKELETAGKNEDASFIAEKAPVLITLLKDFLSENSIEDLKIFSEDDDEKIPNLLSRLKDSCGDYDEAEAVKLIREIRSLPHTKATAKLLEDVETHILHSEFEEACELF
jgi:CheY-like chemotaxis protein